MHSEVRQKKKKLVDELLHLFIGNLAYASSSFRDFNVFEG